MPLNIIEHIRIVAAEIYLHRTFTVIMFIVICFASLVVGINWPKVYQSSTTVFIEEHNIIGPLTSGVAVQTQNTDRARAATDIIFGRKIMTQVIGSFYKKKKRLTPAEVDRLIAYIKKRTQISEVGGNLIKIEYEDNDPERTFRVTKSLANSFITGSLDVEIEESKSAYDFINQQTEQYKKKLQESEEIIKKFREKNADISAETESQIANRITQLKSQAESLKQDLKEGKIKRNSLIRQLSGDTQSVDTLSRVGQYRERLAQLQAELDTQLLIYYDTYPDVVRLRNQISELRNSIHEEEKQQEEKDKIKEKGSFTLNKDALENPLYQELVRDYYQTNTNIQTIEARIEQVNQLLQENIELAKKNKGASDSISALMKDYEATREIYYDFLRRRETARVSMQIDREKKGINLRIEDPAFFPNQPSGPLFWQIILGGVWIAVVIPIGMILTLYKFDPRIKSETIIAKEIGLPILGVIQHADMPRDMQLQRIWNLFLVVIFLATFTTMLVISYFALYDIVPEIPVLKITQLA